MTTNTRKASHDEASACADLRKRLQGEPVNAAQGDAVAVCDRSTGVELWRGTVVRVRQGDGTIYVKRDGSKAPGAHVFSRFGAALLAGPPTWRLRRA